MTTSEKRFIAGLFLLLFGVFSLTAFAVAGTVHRYQNETLTETQLNLWALRRWWAWLPGVAAAGLGLWMTRGRKG